MQTKILRTDEELEQSIDKFVNDKSNFQSRHFKDQFVENQRVNKRMVRDMPNSALRFHIFQQEKQKIHKSYRKAFNEYLSTLSREALLEKLKFFANSSQKG